MQNELLVRSAILVQISPLVQMSLKRPISPIVQSAILVQNTSLAAPGHSLTACNASPSEKSKIATRGPQNGRQGLKSCLPLGFWALPSTFAK